MKRYSLSLTIAYTEEDLKEAGLEHLTELEIQLRLEEEFSELVESGGFYKTVFKVEEV